MKKRFLSVLLAMILIVAMVPMGASAAETEGQCGDDVYWSFANGTLTISGTGDMDGDSPWRDFADQIVTIDIKEGVTGIYDGAFINSEADGFLYSSLTTVNIPEGVTYIGNDAFGAAWDGEVYADEPGGCSKGASKLVNVTLPSTLKEIGVGAFKKTGLTSVELPEGVVIGPEVFAHCTDLESVTLPNTLEVIPPAAFSDCTSLTKITFPSSLKEIDNYAFSNDPLTELELPEGLESIGIVAFSVDFNDIKNGPSTIKKLVIPSSVKYIGPWAFIRWKSLETLIFAEDCAAEIDEGAFAGCDSLKSVTLPKNVTLTGDPFGFDEQDRDENSDLYRVPYDDFVIAGYSGSDAEKYAGENGFEFICLDAPEITVETPEDLAKDGLEVDVDTLPAEKAQDIVNTLVTGEYKQFAGDMEVVLFDLKLTDGDGKEIHDREVTVVIPYPNTDVAKNWETYAFVVLHRLEDGTVELVEVEATPYGLVYTGTCSGFGIAYGEKAVAFTDVAETDWFYTPVQWAVANNVTAGTSATTFSPGSQCTRAQAVTFLWNAQGQPEPQGTSNPFTDVKTTDWYYKAVLWAVENNITAGTSATTFSPNTTCTRAQIVTFLHNYAGKPTASGNNPFTDVPSSQWYYQPVLWAVSNGVTAGMTPTSFGPTSTCTRGQIVTFLYNYLGK